MAENEYQREEGKLLAAALERSGRSARKVAAAIELSDTRLRHIINGYQPMGGGQKVAVIGPPDTIARAANELGVTADQLSDAGRVDAAVKLRAMQAGPIDKFAEGLVAKRVEALAELREHIATDLPEGRAPDSALFLFDDMQLVDEVRRRMEYLRRRYFEMLQMKREPVDISTYRPPDELSEFDDTLDAAAKKGDLEPDGAEFND